MTKVNLQEKFLNDMTTKKRAVTIFVTNGFCMTGVIQEYDNYVIQLKRDDGNIAVVYKHAISTIMPGRHSTHD